MLRMALFDANPPLDSQMARYVETLRLVGIDSYFNFYLKLLSFKDFWLEVFRVFF